MLTYIFRRLILIVPTLVGIMCINFFLVQFVPGGPIEQIISDLEKNESMDKNLLRYLTVRVKKFDLETIRKIMETNYFGALRMIQKVIPSMRSRRSGAIINVSSQAGRRPFALMSHYCATKYALNGLSESMAHELARFNIRVTLIEPGTVITPIFGKGNSIPEDEENYSVLQGRMIRQVTKGLTELGCGPEVIAKCMVDFVTTEDPKLHYLLASDAVDNVDVYQKYGPETWVADGEILDDDEFFSVMKDRYGYEIG